MLADRIDFDDFWENSEHSSSEYTGKAVTQDMIDNAEKKLAYKLPESYIELLRSQNGGIPKNTIFPTHQATSWAQDHVAIAGIFGLDPTKEYSLTGESGSEFMIAEWEYPRIGIYICDCPSGGHDMLALDYTECGKSGEPKVVHVDQEWNYKITILATNFEEFIVQLRPESTTSNGASW